MSVYEFEHEYTKDLFDHLKYLTYRKYGFIEDDDLLDRIIIAYLISQSILAGLVGEDVLDRAYQSFEIVAPLNQRERYNYIFSNLRNISENEEKNLLVVLK